MVFAVIFGIGDMINNKTKAIISSLIFGTVVYLFGFISGIFPADTIDSTFMPSIMGAFGVSLVIVNLGTMMNIKELIAEWKTVLTALAGFAGIAIVAFTIGSVLFGRERALLGSAPISGGLIAAIIAADAANEAARGDLAAYVTLLNAFQMFVGIPIASIMLKKEAARLLGNRSQLTADAAVVGEEGTSKFKLIKAWPESMKSNAITLAKLAIVAWVSVQIANMTIGSDGRQILNQNVLFLIMGVIATEIGFLEKTALQGANAFGFLMFATIAMLPGNFKTVDVPMLLDMLWPLVGMLVICGIAIAIMSAIVGKFLGYSLYMSAAIGVCCLFGYPCTQLITEDVCRTLDCDEETRELVKGKMMPKMIVSGFTTVTIGSVVFAGIIVPMVF